MRHRLSRYQHLCFASLAAMALLAIPSGAAQPAAPVTCSLDGYVPDGPIRATASAAGLLLTWTGEGGSSVGMRLGVKESRPIIERLAIDDRTIVENAGIEYRLTTGFRRMSNQQMEPLRDLGVALTDVEIDEHKWDAFWDAPLDLSVPSGRPGGNPPPVEGVASQPGLPRNAAEIARTVAHYAVDACAVRSDGGRLSVTFPGMASGLFTGDFVLTVFQGTNLVKTEFVAGTAATSVAYKYDVGITGLALNGEARVVWRDTAHATQAYGLAGPVNENPVTLVTANRVVVAETGSGAIAAFPPPHTYFWAREVEVNVGNNWYRKDGDSAFTIGIRQGEHEVVEQYRANWSLYSAPPGTVQRMAAFFYPVLGHADRAFESALAFTRGDRFKPLPGYKVMGAHYHTNIGERLLAGDGVDMRLSDFEALRASGMDIASVADRPRDRADGPTRLQTMQALFAGARRHSDESFLVVPNIENSVYLGGHWDLLLSRPTYWTEGVEGQPFKRTDPVMGTVYNVTSAADAMRMIDEQNMLVYMPHPRTKGSTHYPDAIKDAGPFDDDRYRGVGWRWGMGSDLSEVRLSEKRVLPLFDDMNNWMAAKNLRPKYVMAITETYAKKPGDDIYANNPVNYLELDALPTGEDYSPIVDAMSRGDYFVTSGEVLIPSHSLTRSGTDAVWHAEVQWTFPLDFVEVVWGDGDTTERKIVSTTDLAPFGTKSFAIPFDAARARWARFAAWDTAGNGAMTQPVPIPPR